MLLFSPASLTLLSFRFHRHYLRLLSSQHFCTINSPSCVCCLLSPARDVCENRSALREQVQDYHTVCTGKLSHLASFVKKGTHIMYMWVMTSLHDSTGALLWVASSVNTVHGLVCLPDLRGAGGGGFQGFRTPPPLPTSPPPFPPY